MVRPSIADRGLTGAEAEAGLARHGPNLVQSTRVRGLGQIVRSTLREPMFLLLLFAAGLYLVFGSLGEGVFLLGGATVSVGLVVIQELRSERALAALNALAEPLARVIRDGKPQIVPARSLVPGDLLVVAEGGRIPADAVLVAGDALTVDESALTGESATVLKCAAEDPADPAACDAGPGEEMSSALFAGTMIVRGQGLALVSRTGGATRLGRIGAELAGLSEEPTLLQRNVGRLIARLGILALAFCLAVALAYGLLRGDWFQGALAGITLAISLLPEEFPMVLAVFMALGAWRLARHNVLVRRSAVIETLGATTLLCVDKTGTLTENRMALACVWRDGRLYDLTGGRLPEEALPVVTAAQLASAVQAHDAMDLAVHRTAGAPPCGAPLRSYPLHPGFLAFVQVWPEQDGAVVYAAKGAPETVFRLCGEDADAVRLAEGAAQLMAERGMRVLAVARARFDPDPGQSPEGLAFRFVGLIGFADPVRPDVPAALAEASRAGVGVAMITGDYPATALAIARDAGIDAKAGIVAGADLAGGLPAAGRLADVRIFARIMPEQKLRLVEGFRAAGHVVAMTGDGINDAPALAAADVGIAMGRRGTDVAREASDLILLDDRFASIIGGIRLGRRIFANLRRAMIFITAIHIPIAGMALLPILIGIPPFLFPMHVVLLELLLDPLCSLVFESEPSEDDAMARPPRPANESLFGLREMLVAGVQGTILLGAVLTLYWWSIASGIPDAVARSQAFIALVVGNLSLALAVASSLSTALFDRRRIAFWIIAPAALTALAATVLVPQLASILQFSVPSAFQVGSAILIGAAAGSFLRLARLGARAMFGKGRPSQTTRSSTPA